jgi:DNA-binding transcriptional regulator YiaG
MPAPLPAMSLERVSLVKLNLKEEVEETMKSQTARERSAKTHGLPNLRLLRQRKGLSIGQLAEMTGLRRDTIAHLESGREDPQPYHLRLLARVLDVQQLELVS